MGRRIYFASLAVIGFALFCLLGCKKKKTDDVLKVYAVIHEEETKALLDLFESKTGIKTAFMRSSTGELMNKIAVEKDNPAADVLLGGASSYHIYLDNIGALEPYKSPASEGLPKYAKSPDNTWTGFCVLTLGIGVNAERYNQKFSNIPIPTTWDELLNSAYKGEIVMTNPVASSTAYLFLQNQLQRLGDSKGWEYLSTLSQLVGQFPESGSAPARLIGSGEYSLGISYLHALSKYSHEGFNIKVIPVPQSVGDVDCVAILKGAKNSESAEKFVDFMLSKEAQELMAKISYVTPLNPDADLPDGGIDISSLDFIEYDVQKASSQRDKVLNTWSHLIR